MWENANLVLAAAGEGHSYWEQPGQMGWYWFMGLHGFFWVLVVVLMVAVLAMLMRPAIRGGRPGNPAPESGLIILEARYARGEIDRDEYRRRKQDLI
jgi:putative membrane protein